METSIASMVLTVVGLCLFEVVSSLDNAVVNADVLATMSAKWRRWFLIWGILTSVFLIRGILPWLIVWCANPTLGAWGSLTAAFNHDPRVVAALQESSPPLLTAGGVFLVFLFLHWLFLEPKNYAFKLEKILMRHGVWFFAFASVILTLLIWFGLEKGKMIAFAAAVGSSAFFITHGFKEHALKAEEELKHNRSLSDVSKLMYLEILDATFSIDGVIGAFAFTMNVPLILLGNGLGAVVVRELTIRGVDRIKDYPYLKNGAMYSILFLGIVMVAEGFGVHIPHYLAPLLTIILITIFFVKSLNKSK